MPAHFHLDCTLTTDDELKVFVDVVALDLLKGVGIDCPEQGLNRSFVTHLCPSRHPGRTGRAR